MVVDHACLYLSGPPSDEGHADATFMGGAFGTLQQLLGIEEVGVCPTLSVRAIITGEDDKRVLIEPLLTQQVEDLSHMLVEAGHHGGKLLMPHVGGVIA